MSVHFEKVLSICAILIALGATIVTFYQTTLLKKHQEISVWPHLSIYTNGQAEIKGQPLTWNLYLYNQGLGPAVVKRVSYFFKESEVPSFVEVLRPLHFSLYNEASEWVSSDKVTFQVVLPGKEILLIGTPSTKIDAKALQLFDSEAQIQVCYCSLYNDCWLFLMGSAKSIRKVVAPSTCDKPLKKV